MTDARKIAYFSMEIGLRPDIPTYAGGLGVLAGDTVRAAADSQFPMVAVTLLHRKGYFFQRLDHSGWQTEEPVQWVVEDLLNNTGVRSMVHIEGRRVDVPAWRYDVGQAGFVVPVLLLDTNLESNTEWDRTLTDQLYGGDQHYRLCQEVVLGIGGVRILRAMGYNVLERFHMNEGHAALLTLELLREQRDSAGRSVFVPADLEAVRRQCIFTTHTPVPAGHDQFSLDLTEQVLGDREACGLQDSVCHEGRLNMTYLALSLSHYINVNREANGGFDVNVFTIGFARRATAYKRASLILEDVDRLRRIAREVGRLQLVFSGKAHLQDDDGKRTIQLIFRLAKELAGDLLMCYLPNYDMHIARIVTAGVDLWLNTPQPPLEASGTSGMKAALNGVPSLSILDGWWIEGCIEGTTGWAIDGGKPSANRSQDATSSYCNLEEIIVPTFYHHWERFIEVMRHAIALNGSFFNTQRMVQQYAQKAYL